ncbi:MAG TPA: KUP/HAK/KT family potassium transporter [Xanthobacteraceae bacterium]|nr:KUP/HAK/KT family potassium transporter [Xanthobacteraceae bacterium]
MNAKAPTQSDAGPSRGSELHKGSPFFLALTAIGIVFGDIGTSPLYTFSVTLNATGHPEPTAGDVLGIVSLIFWALMAMVSLKYVVLVLRADNDGEGGILALLSLVASERIANAPGLPILVLLGVVGAALLYGDGVITPAISVLSAMEGLKLVAPALDQFILPLTLVILIGLFAVQRRGTANIGRLFGPVMVCWFIAIGLLGAINIYAAPQIIAALSPGEAARFIFANPLIAFAVMGGVFLALTGAEALYADMGHVGPTAIRRAWFGLVLPALLLNYFGQGALVLTDPKAIDSPFYKLAPHWAVIPLIGLAALATIIASQALISGVFSLTRQAMQLGLCPRMRIVSTSSDEAGQIYIPTANWLLMIGTLLIVVLFKTSEHLAGAYGIAVSGTMLVTTILLYRVAIGRWKWPPALAIFIIVVFGAVDATFLASNSLKIVEGGWFPITVGGAMVWLMLCWRQGSSLVRHRLQEMSMPLDRFVANVEKMVVARPPGVGVWLTKVAHGASPILLHHIKQNSVLQQTMILLTFVADRRPRVPFAERHDIESLGHGIYRIQVRLGFMQTPDIPVALKSCKMHGFEVNLDQVHYYIAHEIVVRRARKSAMGAVPFAIYAFLTRVASRAPDFFKLPHDRVLEVGFHIEI